MVKGTPSKGKHSRGKTHIICRRCGHHSMHASNRECSYCGFGKTAKKRKYTWSKKTHDVKKKL